MSDVAYEQIHGSTTEELRARHAEILHRSAYYSVAGDRRFPASSLREIQAIESELFCRHRHSISRPGLVWSLSYKTLEEMGLV
jgi:hypothetical protein